MMMTIEQKPVDEPKKRNRTKFVLQMVVGGAIGWFSMIALDRLVGLNQLFVVMSGAAVIALTMAIIFCLIGLIVLAMSSNRTIFMLNQSNRNAEASEFDNMKPLLFWSAICMMMYAAIMAILALANPADQGPQLLSFWGIIALMIGQTAITWHLWNRYDELYRDVTKESCAVTFAFVEFGLIVWAAAAICGFGIAFDPLAVIVAMTGVYWTVAIWFTVRRGMA
jgi:hypothetical protein